MINIETSLQNLILDLFLFYTRLYVFIEDIKENKRVFEFKIKLTKTISN